MILSVASKDLQQKKPNWNERAVLPSSFPLSTHIHKKAYNR